MIPRKILVSALAALFIACMAFNVFIHLSYAYTKPQLPHRASGRICRIVVNHGTVVFVTPSESRLAHFVLKDVFWLGMGTFIALISVAALWKK
jgi:hypothetical protein